MKIKYRIFVASVILPFVITGIFLIFLPDQIPMHYNFKGEMDRMGSKYEMMLLPVAYLIPAALMYFLAKYQRKTQEYRNESILIIAGILIQLMQIILLSFSFKTALTYTGPTEQPIDMNKLIGIGIGIAIIVLGNIMPKAARNNLFGMRTTWSLKNDRVWQQSQRFAGYSGILCGLLIVLSGIFFSQLTVFLVITGLLLLWVTICVIASYRFYKADLQNGAE